MLVDSELVDFAVHCSLDSSHLTTTVAVLVRLAGPTCPRKWRWCILADGSCRQLALTPCLV